MGPITPRRTDSPPPLAVGDRVQTHSQDEFGVVEQIKDGGFVQVRFGERLKWLNNRDVLVTPDEETIYALAAHFKLIGVERRRWQSGK